MKRYLLLRNNRETGPYSREELKDIGLLPTDLLWIEGESRSWEYATEIQGLKSIAKAGIKIPLASTDERTSATATQRSAYLANINEPDAYIDSMLSGGGTANRTIELRGSSRMQGFQTEGSRFFGALVLLIGLGLCAFVAVNLVRQFADGKTAVSQAIVIESEKLPPSVAAHTAASNLTTVPISAAALQADSITMMAPSFAAQSKKLTQTSLKRSNTLPTDTAKKTAAPPVASNATSEVVPVADDEPEPVKETPEKPSLQLSANDYKVGLFGGISDLEITVTNPSSQPITKAAIEVEYLKPNGNVVKTQTVVAENISANSSKTISVPSSSRGVKARYRIVQIETN